MSSLNYRFLLYFALIILTSCVIPTYKARISLRPTSQSNQEVKVNSLLIVGSGSVTSEIFLENLSSEIISNFKRKGINADFRHLGKASERGPTLDTLVSSKYDTYLVFNSTNSGFLDMSKDKYMVVGPVSGTGYGNQYKETFKVSLYNGKEKLQTIWQGDLAIDFDVANQSRYKQISELIFGELTKKHIKL